MQNWLSTGDGEYYVLARSENYPVLEFALVDNKKREGKPLVPPEDIEWFQEEIVSRVNRKLEGMRCYGQFFFRLQQGEIQLVRLDSSIYAQRTSTLAAKLAPTLTAEEAYAMILEEVEFILNLSLKEAAPFMKVRRLTEPEAFDDETHTELRKICGPIRTKLIQILSASNLLWLWGDEKETKEYAESSVVGRKIGDYQRLQRFCFERLGAFISDQANLASLINEAKPKKLDG